MPASYGGPINLSSGGSASALCVQPPIHMDVHRHLNLDGVASPHFTMPPSTRDATGDGSYRGETDQQFRQRKAGKMQFSVWRRTEQNNKDYFQLEIRELDQRGRTVGEPYTTRRALCFDELFACQRRLNNPGEFRRNNITYCQRFDRTSFSYSFKSNMRGIGQCISQFVGREERIGWMINELEATLLCAADVEDFKRVVDLVCR